MTFRRMIGYLLLIIFSGIVCIYFERCVMTINEVVQPEPVFLIFGDQDILDEMVINIEPINYQKNNIYTCSRVQTALYNGKRYAVENKKAQFYRFYFSYKDQVSASIRKFENLANRGNYFGSSVFQINRFYVTKKDNIVYVKYYTNILNLNQYGGDPGAGIVMDIKDYFVKNDIPKDEQTIYKKKFFDLYEPDIQRFRKDPLSKEFIESFKEKILSEKKEFNLDIVDIQNIDIPETEKQTLIEHTKKEQFVSKCYDY